MADSIYLSRAGAGHVAGDCHIVATIDRRIASSSPFARQHEGLKYNRRRRALAAKRENEMELQREVQTTAMTTMGITREMLLLTLNAIVSGTVAAVVAGLLVVTLTVIAA